MEARNITNELSGREEIFGFYMADEPYMKSLSKDMPFAYRHADRELFALSDGASCVELSRLGLTKILRPMYPLDEFDFDPTKE
jgi:hypothetical protein